MLITGEKKNVQIFPIKAWLHGLISYWRISVSLKHDPARQTEAEECPAFPQTLRRQRRTQTDRQGVSRLERALMLPRQDITPFHGNEHLLISAKATAENLN